MKSTVTEKDNARLSRFSKARIFNGNPLKLDMYATTVMVLIYVSITVVISISFSYFQKTDHSLVLWSLLPGALLGIALLILERSLGQLKNFLLPQMGRLLTCFLLFFIHIIGYLSISSIVVSYPVGYFMEKTGFWAGMSGEYSLFSVNFFIVLALLSWLRNVRSSPIPCF